MGNQQMQMLSPVMQPMQMQEQGQLQPGAASSFTTTEEVQATGAQQQVEQTSFSTTNVDDMFRNDENQYKRREEDYYATVN